MEDQQSLFDQDSQSHNISNEQVESRQQQSAFSSSNSEYEQADTNPFSASVSAMNEDAGELLNSSDAGDAWDFDETSRVSDSNAANSHPKEIEYGANHSGRSSTSSHRRPTKHRASSDSRAGAAMAGSDSGNFKVKFALRGHLDVIRAVIFTGGGTASEPEICTAGDDGVLKRWHIPGSYGLSMGVSDMDIQSHFTHRGHSGMVTCLAVCPAASTEGGLSDDGWIFSGGQDSTVRVWEAGKVGPKATLVGHTDAVWAVCVLPSASTVFGSSDSSFGRVLLASGSADGTVKIWSLTPPASVQQSHSNASSMRGSFRGIQPSVGSYGKNSTFDYSLITTIARRGIAANPTCITPMSITGETFVVSYDDAAVIIYDTVSGEEMVSMMSQETYDGTPETGVNSVVASTLNLESGIEAGREDEALTAGATGLKGGVGGVIISGHEDQFVRIFDANSGKCISPAFSLSSVLF